MHTGILNTDRKFTTGRLLLLSAACLLMALAGSSMALADIKSPPLSTWFVQMDQYAAGAHGTLNCQECHGPMIDMNTSHPDEKSDLFLKKDPMRTFDYQTCKKCHTTAHTRVMTGEHAKAFEKEKEEGKPSKTGFAPRCGDCHSSHYEKSHKSRAQVGREMILSCGTCHPNQVASYLENYHGKAAVNLGYEDAAFCTDCHGAHATVSLKDKDVLLNTCRRCHPDAKDEFANIIIHDSTHDLEMKTAEKQSLLKEVHILGTLSLLFIVAVLVFFYTHTGLLMLRKLHEKLRRHK